MRIFGESPTTILKSIFFDFPNEFHAKRYATGVIHISHGFQSDGSEMIDHSEDRLTLRDGSLWPPDGLNWDTARYPRDLPKDSPLRRWNAWDVVTYASIPLSIILVFGPGLILFAIARSIPAVLGQWSWSVKRTQV